MSRHAGLLIPLSAAPSASSWGIGEIADLESLVAWAADALCDRLMILPIGTMPPGESSPYSAVSAMAIDPIYVSVDRLEDFALAGGLAALGDDARRDLDRVRASSRVSFTLVRRLKMAALERAFGRFVQDEWEQLTTRAASFAAYLTRERWWLEDYALFQALASAHGTTYWRRWPAPVRDREPRALDEARRFLAMDVRRHQYWQWIAETQWQDARDAARARGVAIVGDLPFAVSAESPDVWARPHEFRLDVSTGVPPDAFSETGQDWRLPLYNWEIIAKSDFDWIRRRSKRMAALYDSFRIDHLVGFYRTYGRPEHGDAFFSPPDEPSQIHQGERILQIFRESGAEILAEDLGSIPPFVHESLARMGLPGLKVIRWERAWSRDERPYVDPRTYPAMSVAVTGTHDTEPLAVWWEATSAEERTAACGMWALAERGISPEAPWSNVIRDAWLDLAYGAASDHLFLPIQDVFGWPDRINTPATVNDANWTWRLPWLVNALNGEPQAIERRDALRALREKFRGR